jgi:hypothetical protein
MCYAPNQTEIMMSRDFPRMTLHEFWQLIDTARKASSKLDEVPRRLIDMLCKLEESEIVDFWSHHLDCLHRSYDARLWLAAVVTMRGCGDDTFSDFRDWLIALGQSRFESALDDPDSLADLDSFDGDESAYPTLFYFGSVASNAFCKKSTGNEHDSEALMRFEALCPVRAYPLLKNKQLLDASDEQARVMFPKLAARFPIPIYTSPFT